MFIIASVLYRPVEQLLSRSIADHDARRVSERRPLRVAAQVQLGLALAFALLALIFKGPLEDELFGGSSTLFWIMLATVLTYGGSYYARGVLAGRRRFRAYGALLVLESSTRVLFALGVAVGIASGVSFVAFGMAVGSAVSLAVIAVLAARALRGADSAARRASASGVPPEGRGTTDGRAGPGGGAGAADVDSPPDEGSVGEPELSLAHGTGYAAGVLAIMVSEQAFLAGGPLVINATEAAAGAALAGFAFNAVLIARAPLQLFQAVQASILPHLTRLRAGGHTDPFHRSIKLTLIAVALFATVAATVLLAVGPSLMTLLFGDDYSYARGGLALMGVGVGFYLTAVTLTQAALARGQAGRAAARWGVGAGTFVAMLLTPIEDRVLQVEVAFCAGALVLCLGLALLYRGGDGPVAGADPLR